MFPLAVVEPGLSLGEGVVRLLLACVLGGAVGLEREFHGRPAGLRTHIMVCLGATIAMLANDYLALLSPDGSALRIDPGRIAAGILTGIGFIGAGAILRLRNTHRGLTTAACIWFVAALGLVVGAGSYAVAVAGTVLALLVLLGLKAVEDVLHPHWYREVVVVAGREENVIERVRTGLALMDMDVQSYDFEDNVAREELRVTFSVRFRRRDAGEEVLGRLREVPGVRSITWRAPSV